jgi:DNA ligase (NAD+)
MTMQESYEELVNVLHFHEWRYYVQDDPIIADVEYDQLFNLLKETEGRHPEWILPDSPTQRVGSDLTSDFPTVAHLSPMLSLPNSYDANDLLDFDKQIKKLTLTEDDLSYVVEPKFDGGTIVLIYENDQLIRGATRGNGAQGDDITNNIKTIRSIPLTAEFSRHGLDKVELRGEALIRKDRFEAMNDKRLKNGEVLFANPRNTATGGLRTKDPKETEARMIDAFIYQISYMEGSGAGQLSNQAGSIKLLESLGFKVPIAESKVCHGIKAASDFCAEWQEKRDNYPYEIDGMVVKVNEFALQQKAGETSHHPRWAIAYKFKAKQATTTLEQVVYQVGKVGTITPVAKVTPVALAGVTVSSISLHNEDFITQKDLRIGDTVLIERAGDVIPYVVKSFPDLRTGQEEVIHFPEFCPINDRTDVGVALIRDENESAWRCPDCVCGAQDLQRMAFFISKDAMNIDGMGKSNVETFFELKWLRDISDLYNLDYEAIAQLEGFGERSAEKIRLAIEQSKSNPIHRLLYGLGIHHLGRRASKIFAAEISHVLDLRDWSEEKLMDLKDIGPVLARNTTEWFSKEKNIELLHRLEARGVNLTQTDEDRPKDFSYGVLAGKTILFTGTLTQMGRKEAQRMAEEMGAKNISAVSKNLDILVAGEKAGSKLKKAEALGSVQIMTEEEFIALI